MTNTPSYHQTDVAIVGYGPTGMTLAALLAQSGHRVVVLERYTGLYNLPRAACFDDEIMRLFQKLGLADAVLPGAVVQESYDWINARGETLVELAYDNPAPGGWAALYMMYQPHVEAVLDQHIKRQPKITVLQGVTVQAVTAEEDGVTVTGVDQDNLPVNVRAAYAVGADGGASLVREVIGASMDDYGFQENWLVCDFRKRRPLTTVPTFRQVCDPRQPTSIVRIGPDHQRFSFMLDPDESRESATDERRVWQRVSPYISPADADLVRVANYVYRSRIADSWRQGRILLAGDAAHEMPPFLGQGMCSGMRDAHNLAWKLSLILSGRASDGLLDTYQPERDPHVRFITEKAIELGRVQTLRDPEAARERDERLLTARRDRQEPEKLTFPPVRGGHLVDPDDSPDVAGHFFPQARVLVNGHEDRFDQLVGRGATLFAASSDLIPVGSRGLERWRLLGGHVAQVITDSSDTPGTDVAGVVDLDGIYSEWFEAHHCRAVLVRPDWYVYGGTADADGLARLLDQFSDAFVPSPTR